MRAMFADPFGFLPKPYTPDDLTTALGNLLAIEPGPGPRRRARRSAARRRERRQLFARRQLSLYVWMRFRYAWTLLRRWDCEGGLCCAIARWL